MHRRVALTQASKRGVPRGLVLGLVFALHMGVGVLFLASPVTGPTSSMTIVSSALEVRFIRPPPKLTVARKQPTSSPEVGTTIKRRSRSGAEHVPVTDPSPADMTTQMILSSPSPTAKTYVPGGRLLEGVAAVGRSNTRLPGVGNIKGAPRFRMVDPKSQGLAGVIHFIGGLAGAVDRHCLDLDAWQAMTPEKRIENHVSDDDMEKIREGYDCESFRVHRPF